MKKGWYIVQAHAPDHVSAQFLLFNYDQTLVDHVRELRRLIKGVEQTHGGWGSICLNGVVQTLALTSLPALPEFAGINEEELESSEEPQFVAADLSLDRVYGQAAAVFRSDCHAMRVFSKSVHIRVLCKYSSAEVESACISQMFEEGVNVEAV